MENRPLVQKRIFSQKSRLTLFLLISSLCVGCDQVTKQIATNHLQQSGILSFLGDILRFQYMENSGAFLGLGNTLPPETRFWLFTVLNGGVLLALGYWIMSNTLLIRAEFIAFTLILAGGIGNQIDRMMNQGQVIDFINVGIGSIRTGIFNVADMAISLGVVLMLRFMFQDRDNIRPTSILGRN
ncbi:MAG: signal peptidase II [Nitrospirae bacterium]|nr:signal peptidase II [Candidatus Manganitrophaceae bacterium]